MSKAIHIRTAKPVMPTVYAYSTPQIAEHDGWVKIGYTEKQTSAERQKQQSHTVDVVTQEEWSGDALFDDTKEAFTDHDFHAYLRRIGIAHKKTTEWYHIDGQDSYEEFLRYRENHGILKAVDEVRPYTLRKEQEEAAARTAEYMQSHDHGSFLWNAKPRFGKTLTAYDFCKRVQARNVLIITNRPAIANSWYEDYVQYLGDESGYKFVSHVDALKDRKYCISREDYVKLLTKDDSYGCIEFVSLQDAKGSKHVNYRADVDKLKELADITWDVLILDEAHEAVDTYLSEDVLRNIHRRFTLHLSGTPFKALANDKFPSEAIYNWTYADEQKAKAEWDGGEDGTEENPYGTLPKLNLFTYQMSQIIEDEVAQGVEINGETEEYAFDLNEFFATKNGRFVHEESVDKFLDALARQEKFPFSTPELRDELRHTFWLLNRVDSARALEKKLKEHEVFKEYHVVLAAGDGIKDDEDEIKKSYDKVRKAIAEHEKTITLSVGQLTTGVTIPEWTAVLMLSSIKSPALYMQAAFRAQNPCLFCRDGEYLRKEDAYVFDFDPARTLILFEQFANDLLRETADGRGDLDIRKKHIETLLNFFPVIGEDKDGEMVELDAAAVLTIPRKIKSQEVVKRGFMSDFLFQNVSNIFHAPPEVVEIVQNFQAYSEPKSRVDVDENTADNLSLDEDGEVELSDDYVIGRSADMFGDKIYEVETGELHEAARHAAAAPAEEKKTPGIAPGQLDQLKDIVKAGIAPRLETAKEQYGDDLKESDKKKFQKKFESEADRLVERHAADYGIQQRKLEAEKEKALEEVESGSEEEQQVLEKYQAEGEKLAETFSEKLAEAAAEYRGSVEQEIVRGIETKKKEEEKAGIESAVRDHLRGFSRTIPSFLMAYGDENVTLETFDSIIPEEVFLEVTGITIDQFRFLRDGGDYVDENTGETKHFGGHLFDPVVFDDSAKEFLGLRRKLADYFEESATEDIFDYIPPQKTNQIFTPKKVVTQMADMLEEENPGCFDDPGKTFIDLYMKSGLYITEIVKRLYQSDKLKALYPDREERLKHIFRDQVYGLAPTEIIYQIATNYILGFDEDMGIAEHNFRQVDALPYAKDGTLEQLLDGLYGEKLKEVKGMQFVSDAAFQNEEGM